MSANNSSVGGVRRFLGTFAWLLLTNLALGQTTASSPMISASTQQATLQAFRQEQGVLAGEEQALIAGGATKEQLRAWRQQNAAAFVLQNQQCRQLANAAALALLPENVQPIIPANATATTTAFLTAQAAVANARAHIHNQLVRQATASGTPLSTAQIQALHGRERQLFQKQNASLLATESALARSLALEQAQRIQRVPPVVTIPNGTPPQEAAVLSGLNQMERERIQLQNQYANASSVVRAAAIHAWIKAHAAQMANLQQQHLTLSQATPPASQ